MGIIFMMFVIGVQLSLRELVRTSRIAIAGGLLQVVAMIAIGYAVGRAFGWSPVASYVFGAVISNSSSTVIGKVLGDRGELEGRHAQIALAWSSVQDISTVVLIAILAFLLPTERAVAPLLGKAALFFFVLLPASFWAVPWLLRRVGAMRSREFFVLSVVTLALAMASGAALLGVSLALGAFFTGIVVGESDLAHRVLGDTMPLRDAFSGIFFVSIGMLLDPAFLLEAWAPILVTVALIVAVKGALSAAIARWLGCSARLAALLGACLAQSAEFSFLMARIGIEEGALTPEVFNLLLSATVISILLAPSVNDLAPGLLRARRSGATPPDEFDETRPPALRAHAIVCGYGRVGSIVCALFERHGQPYVVVEDDLRTYEELRARGVPALLGDAGLPVVLERAHVRSAHVLVLCIPERMVLRRALEYARDVNPSLAVLARTHTYEDRDYLERHGAAEAVVGELELALELGRCALHRFGVAPEAIAASLAKTRATLR
ncbi:MAG: hypothetical protein DCC71_17710 [Proteobacteria bacterium]|nr:MAG: hypothetical protein DCC71_17710 [Pseudomonadota bacterium]